MCKKKMQRGESLIIGIIFLSFLQSSCKASRTPTVEQEYEPVMPILEEDVVSQKAQLCSDLIHAHIDGWNSRDIEQLKKIYADDIVHFDAIPLYVGIEEVAEMAEGMWRAFPEWEMAVGNTYISESECLGEWINWGVFTLTEEEPGLEFDLISQHDGKIYFWRAFYDAMFLDIFGHSVQLKQDILQKFASVWSAGDLGEITDLYADEAIITDSLFQVSLEGSEDISNYIIGYFRQFPDVEWILQYPFAEDYSYHLEKEDSPYHPQGGVYSITIGNPDDTSCEIRAVVILTPDNDDKIINQSIYYDAESLVDCGLAQ